MSGVISFYRPCTKENHHACRLFAGLVCHTAMEATVSKSQSLQIIPIREASVKLVFINTTQTIGMSYYASVKLVFINTNHTSGMPWSSQTAIVYLTC
jgi:hypothetical protein